MLKFLLGTTLLFLLQIGTSLGKFVVETNSLKVTYPSAINGSYQCAIGNFGVPRYGGSITGNVVYPETNQLACSAFENGTFTGKTKQSPVFLLADRGVCYFILKTWNAQLSGAAAILVTDDSDEDLITMDTPESGTNETHLLPNITIPSVLITKSLGDKIKTSLSNNKTVKVVLDWTESLPHPDERVEYEFWMNSNNECGQTCRTQIEFINKFRGVAQILEKGGYTKFTPHYITWFCPEDAISTIQCKSQCIHHGRYCAPDPEGDLTVGYEGKNVVIENLRQACFFAVANESGKPWLWWDYAADFAIRCPMKENKYNKDCADQVIQSLGVDVKKIDECIGDTEADMDNLVLLSEQEAQIGEGTRGDITILPTLVINNRQYRGSLDVGAVLKAICAGFKEATDPSICLAGDVETNECLVNNGGCWQDTDLNVTACKDTFRGRVCECPTVQGVQFIGNGYTSCEASGPLRCSFGNGGCWKEIRNNSFYSACFEDKTKGCQCPTGFNGDGVNSCEDVDECKEKLACQCPECKCKNTWGSYQCTCSNNLLYMQEHDTCIAIAGGRSGWSIFWIGVLVLAAAGAAGYLVYKYRIRRYMDAEIRGIMAQYMPLDDHEVSEIANPNHTQR